MSSMPVWVTDLEAAATRSVEHAAELAQLSAADELEALRRLAAVRDAVRTPMSLLASDVQRRSERALGALSLARQHGFADGPALIQDLAGMDRSEVAKLVRLGAIREHVEALAPHLPTVPAAGASGNDSGAGSDSGRGTDLDDTGLDRTRLQGTGLEGPSTGGPDPAVRLLVPTERSIEALRRVPGGWVAPIAVALADGWLTPAQADVLRKSLGSPCVESLTPGWRQAALDLIGDTWTGHWAPEDLARAAKKTRACLDTLDAQTEARQRFQQRSFRRFVRESGMVHYDLELDPESDARIYGPIRRRIHPRPVRRNRPRHRLRQRPPVFHEEATRRPRRTRRRMRSPPHQPVGEIRCQPQERSPRRRAPVPTTPQARPRHRRTHPASRQHLLAPLARQTARTAAHEVRGAAATPPSRMTPEATRGNCAAPGRQ